MPFIQQQQQQHRFMLKIYFVPGAGTYGIFKYSLYSTFLNHFAQ